MRRPEPRCDARCGHAWWWWRWRWRGGGAPLDGGAAPQQDASLTTEYRWGGVSIHVAATGTTGATGSMTLLVTDRATPATLSGTLTYAASTGMMNGAYVVSRHGCSGDPSLQAVEIHSCAPGSTGELRPGCMAASFDSHGIVAGSFVHATGARCDIRGASADIVLPQPSWRTGTSTEAASGMFLLECSGADGTNVLLEAVFLLPQSTSVLAWNPPSRAGTAKSRLVS